MSLEVKETCFRKPPRELLSPHRQSIHWMPISIVATSLSTPQGAAAEGRGPCYVLYISICGLGGQNNQMYYDLESKAKY